MDNSTLSDKATPSAASASTSAATAVTIDSHHDDSHHGHHHDLKSSPLQQLQLQLHLGPTVDALLLAARERLAVTSIRTLFACLGVGEAEPFNVPPQSQALARLRTNARFFLTNYLLTTAAVFFFLLLFFHRVQLLVCFIVACGWYLVLTKKASELDHIVAFGKRIGEQEVLLFTTAFTVLFLLFFILPTIVFSLSTTFVGSTLHALFRNNRLKDDSYTPLPHKVATSDAASDDMV